MPGLEQPKPPYAHKILRVQETWVLVNHDSHLAVSQAFSKPHLERQEQ